MKRYICILRGINVGGHRKILMKDLTLLLEKDKLENIKTYIQSGNISFDSTISSNSKLEELITNRIKSEYGYDVPVIILTKEEIDLTINNFPYNDEDNKHVTFLQTKPSKELVSKLQLKEYNSEDFIINGKVIYLNTVEKYHQSKLSNNLFEKQLKVSATTRNWKTVKKLKELAGE